MIRSIFGRSRRTATAAALYAAIVAQSRQPVFYTDFDVPDTLDGRFDLIVLNQTLLLRRLMRDEHLKGLAQDVFDAFCRDMDDNLREMGVGDLAVPKKMLEFGEAFYGRFGTYEKALDAGDGDALAAALGRNLFGDLAGAAASAVRMAAYAMAAEAALASADTDAILGGGLRFPDPALVARSALTEERS
jgi:cytochrome b pre-mRNA-processing protein 3